MVRKKVSPIAYQVNRFIAVLQIFGREKPFFCGVLQVENKYFVISIDKAHIFGIIIVNLRGNNMEDFNSFAKNKNERDKKGGAGTGGKGDGGNNGDGLPSDILSFVSEMAGKFDGKDRNALLRAIYEEARKGKESGRLSNADIDRFVVMLSPILDGNKRKYLLRIAEELKKI